MLVSLAICSGGKTFLLIKLSITTLFISNSLLNVSAVDKFISGAVSTGISAAIPTP